MVELSSANAETGELGDTFEARRGRRTGSVAGEEQVQDSVAEELHLVTIQAVLVQLTKLALALVKLAEVALRKTSQLRT